MHSNHPTVKVHFMFLFNNSKHKGLTNYPVVMLAIVLTMLITPARCWCASRNLQELVDPADSSQRTLRLTSGNWDVPFDLELPGAIQLKVEGSATITIASGKKLILHGMLDAPA